MKKKLINFWLLAALMCGLGLSVTSCKDDDDDSKSEEQQQQEQEERASKFWSVVGQLVSSDDYAADYEDKTFEPVYGIADATNETTRIVETNDMQTAARRFSDLVGSSIDENTPSYTYSDPEVGTLTYTRGGTADDWATVDVSIKQVPRLRKIIYREGGEGTNGSFPEKAWYRFGDVVSRTLDNGKVEYWICVRPAFGPEKKGDSHWVCLNYLPPKNFFNYSYDSKSWTVPTGIGTDKENMQNLAEMLYAITRPEQWYNNANTYHTDGKLWGFSGLPIFADFKKANVMYHNQYFWQNVADAWTKHGVADKAMNVQLGDLADRIEQEGIHLLYEGYQWWTKTSWNCKLWQASYTNGTKNDEKNLHHAEYNDITKRMQDIKFDCTKMGSSTDNYIQFFDNDGKYRWVVRHATGADLNNGSQPAPTSRLQGKGVKDFYRYYEEYEDESYKLDKDGGTGPEITERSYNDPAKWNTSEFTGKAHYCYYNVYKDKDGNRWIPVKCAGGTYFDKAPFTYFISFEGLTPSADGRRITNLPNREMAMKMMTWLWACTNNMQNITDDALQNSNGTNVRAMRALVNYAGIDPRHLYKLVTPPEEGRAESAVQLNSVGYTDDDNSTGQQKVLRWYNYPTDMKQLDKVNQRQPTFYHWTTYPKVASKLFYWPSAFSTDPIYLQDIASADLVAKHAEDPYVYCLALEYYAKVPGANVMEPRTRPVSYADKATNFFYEMNTWNYNIYLDMWRAPVLLFRVIRLYDRGDDEYATRSENGITLYPYYVVPDIDDDADSRLDIYRNIIDFTVDDAYKNHYYWVDGKQVTPPTYREEVIR